jgi:hypothetical protein
MTTIVFYFYFLTCKKINEKRKLGRKKRKKKAIEAKLWLRCRHMPSWERAIAE